jgi:hydroxymethylbilane synthase
MTRKLTIGTRGSRLALWQSRHIAQCLRESGVEQVELEVITTTGDRLVDRHPGQMSTKGIFVKEIEDALLQQRVDLAVHSTKDLPGELPAGLTLAAHPERVDPRDVLLTRDGSALEDLPQGAVLGTVSLRRRAQLLACRRDLRFTDMRGNVDTRIRKLEAGDVDGIVLALAGLHRLGLVDARCWPIPVEICLPAPGQGILGIECRAGDQEVIAALQSLEDADARREVTAERTVLAALDAGCLVPLAALARIRPGGMIVQGLVASPDGTKILREERQGSPDAAARLGHEVAEALKSRGALAILRAARESAQGQTSADG